MPRRGAKRGKSRHPQKSSATSSKNHNSRSNNDQRKANGRRKSYDKSSDEVSEIIKKVIKQESEGYADRNPTESPLVDVDGDGNEVLRGLPADDMDEDDVNALITARENAHWLEHDGCCAVLRVTGAIGLIPFLGDFINFIISYSMINHQIRKADVPCGLRCKMFCNLLLSTICGLIPLLGDGFVIWYKVNSRNVFLFEKYLDDKYNDQDSDDDSGRCCCCPC